MGDLPALAICLLTSDRTELAVRTIRALLGNLRYDGPVAWLLAQDSEQEQHWLAVEDALGVADIALDSFRRRMGPGPAWNLAVDLALKHWDYLLWLEDDWELNYVLDINPYVRLLQERADVGTVRLSGLPTGLHCETVGHNGIHYLDILKDRQYCWSGNPSLNHRRHFETYGGFPTDPRVLVGDCELHHDGRVRRLAGPAIWRPVDLLAWGVFGHIGA
jgi:hypothetical protein